MSSKNTPEYHSDRLGQAIKEGSIVAFPISATMLGIGSVTKLSPKTIRVKEVDTKKRSWGGTAQRYPGETVVLNEIPEMLMYLITQQ